jgi:hypothetical protein
LRATNHTPIAPKAALARALYLAHIQSLGRYLSREAGRSQSEDSLDHPYYPRKFLAKQPKRPSQRAMINAFGRRRNARPNQYGNSNGQRPREWGGNNVRENNLVIYAAESQLRQLAQSRWMASSRKNHLITPLREPKSF